MPRPAPAAMLAMLTGLAASAASAQCATTWIAGFGQGPSGRVLASVEWDPDGTGPIAPVIVVGGAFDTVGDVVAKHIAIWNPTTGLWSSIGSGTNGLVTSLALLPNGELVAAGFFTLAGGVAVNNIARWNGAAWSPLGGGCSHQVTSLSVLGNGDLVAGGLFAFAGGVLTNGIARWDGAAWHAFGSGMNGNVFTVAATASGDVLAGGVFTIAGGVATNRIARWNGSAWSPLGSGVDGAVDRIYVAPSGAVFAGGLFTTAGGVAAANIAAWNGTAWAPLGAGTESMVLAFATLPTGELVVGGFFSTAGGIAVRNIATWNGTIWSPLGGGMNSVGLNTLTVACDGSLYAGGSFSFAGANEIHNIARWTGAAWSPLGPPPSPFAISGLIESMVVMPNGDLVAAGSFTSAGGVPVDDIVRWNGSSWSPLGGANDGFFFAITLLPNGDLVGAGTFTMIDGIAANRIARWDGGNWHPLGVGLNGTVLTLATLTNGDIVAAGWFTSAGGGPASGIARWNGTGWSAFGTGVTGLPVRALLPLPNGGLLAGGNFTAAGGVLTNGVAHWDGTAWATFGTLSSPSAFGVAANGDLLAGEESSSSGGGPVKRWNGSAWVAMGPNLVGTIGGTSVRQLRVLPNGDLIVGGRFATAGGVAAENVARWNGASWSAVDGGLGGGFVPDVFAIATLPNGDLVAGGSFVTAGTQTASNLARLRTNCPASVSVLGLGCTGNAGPINLEATALPWLGATFRDQATGLTANALAFGVFGTNSLALPLPALLPQGVSGCVLQVVPEYVELLAPQAGIAASALAIPNQPNLIGQTFLHQVIPLEIGTAAQLTAVTASPPLALSIGAF